jgi:hypothetical protein
LRRPARHRAPLRPACIGRTAVSRAAAVRTITVPTPIRASVGCLIRRSTSACPPAIALTPTLAAALRTSSRGGLSPCHEACTRQSGFNRENKSNPQVQLRIGQPSAVETAGDRLRPFVWAKVYARGAWSHLGISLRLSAQGRTPRVREPEDRGVDLRGRPQEAAVRLCGEAPAAERSRSQCTRR